MSPDPLEYSAVVARLEYLERRMDRVENRLDAHRDRIGNFTNGRFNGQIPGWLILLTSVGAALFAMLVLMILSGVFGG